MPSTYEPIATTTLSSSATGITFSSIPSTYTDLRVVCIASNTAGGNFGFRLNNVSSNFYTRIDMIGSGTVMSAYSPSSAQSYFIVDNAIGGLTATKQLYTMDIFQYTNTNMERTVLITANEARTAAGGYISLQAGLFMASSVINTISCFNDTNLEAGSTATLYGIKAV
jgi:hypothetical protein